MRPRSSRVVSLTTDMEELVRQKVLSGEYADEDEVINDGLMALAARDAALETWLDEEVIPTLDALEANPSRVMPLDEARRRLHGRIDRLVESSSKKK
ncbi:type II toxin-antitoxin system ParD family antitoxin [Rhizobium sp. LjRoot30]|uniref:ribbon-helix-helix domain-containing protein n=1 Tax=Rhizobium sp. LjRoot30 TaxID=3342320 RepID=UPI003ECE7422